jgi:hypothetical protein
VIINLVMRYIVSSNLVALVHPNVQGCSKRPLAIVGFEYERRQPTHG